MVARDENAFLRGLLAKVRVVNPAISPRALALTDRALPLPHAYPHQT
jgi:hypothetical protein